MVQRESPRQRADPRFHGAPAFPLAVKNGGPTGDRWGREEWLRR